MVGPIKPICSFDMVWPFEPVGSIDMVGSFDMIRPFDPVGYLM